MQHLCSGQCGGCWGTPGPHSGDSVVSFYSNDNEGSLLHSLFVHNKVDPRKDAHSTLLSEKEISDL